MTTSPPETLALLPPAEPPLYPATAEEVTTWVGRDTAEDAAAITLSSTICVLVAAAGGIVDDMFHSLRSVSKLLIRCKRKMRSNIKMELLYLLTAGVGSK